MSPKKKSALTRLRESIWLSSNFHSESIIKCDLFWSSNFHVLFECVCRDSVRKQCSWGDNHEDRLKLFPWKIRCPLFPYDYSEPGTNAIYLKDRGSKKKKSVWILCELSFPEAMSEKSPVSTVHCGCHSRCAVSSQARLSLNRTLNLSCCESPRIATQSNTTSVAPRYNTGFRYRASNAAHSKKTAEIPSFTYLLTTFQNVMPGKRGVTLWGSFPCRPRRRTIKGDKAGAAQTHDDRKHTQNTHHTSTAETEAGPFHSKTWESGKKRDKREERVKRSNQSGQNRQHKARATSFPCRWKKGKVRNEVKFPLKQILASTHQTK